MTGVDTDLATLRRIIESVRPDAVPAVARVEAELSRLREEERRLNGYIDQYIQDVGRLREQRDECERQFQAKVGEVIEQMNRTDAAEARCAELQGRVYALETSLPENYMETLGGAEARCARLTEENERLDGLRALYLKSADEWSERCARLESELRSAMGSNAALQQALVNLAEAVKRERRWATGTAEHNDARTHLYSLAREALAGQPTAAEGPDTPADSQEDKT